MQPYNMTPEEEAQEADYLARIARIAQLTDEDVRAMGRKEVYPGYFENDPRHPFFSAEDRYMYDHPGPDWKTKPRLQRDPDQPYRGKRVGWDEEQFTGEPIPTESLPPRPAPKITPIRTGEAERIIAARYYDQAPTEEIEEKTMKQSGLWVCRICRRQLALWPTERALRLKPFGLSLTVVVRSPIACTNCRIFEFPTIQKLGNEDHRKFWQRLILLWEQPILLLPHKWRWIARRLRKGLRRTRAWFVMRSGTW